MIVDVKQAPIFDIIVLPNGDMDAHIIRAVLESFNIQTRMHYIGNVKYLMSLFQDPNRSELFGASHQRFCANLSWRRSFKRMEIV